MTKMLIDRSVVEQALEALKDDQDRMVEAAEGHWEYKTDLAIGALKAALAQQAEPVEPVAGVVLNKEGRAALVEHGREEWHCAARNARRLYTAPPQRLPLPKHDQHCVDVPGYGLVSVRLVRAIERAHGIKENPDD